MSDTSVAYDPNVDNCAEMPECGTERVLFTWFHAPAACCPRCYENLFGAEPDSSFPTVTLPEPAA